MKIVYELSDWWMSPGNAASQWGECGVGWVNSFGLDPVNKELIKELTVPTEDESARNALLFWFFLCKET